MSSPHFLDPETVDEAENELAFRPTAPPKVLTYTRESMAIFVRDQNMNDVATEDRSFEAWYGAFGVSQRRYPTRAEARAAALVTAYGPEPRAGTLLSHEARFYDRGPEVEPGDTDGRDGAKIAFAIGDVFHLVVGSVGDPTLDHLKQIAEAFYS